MTKYRKKPVVIEAMWLGESEQSHIDVLGFINAQGGEAIRIRPSGIRIETLEGPIRASVGDWVIQGVKGEFYPCKPDIFDATYEPVASPLPATPKESGG